MPEDGQGRGGGARGQVRRATGTEAPFLPRRSSTCLTRKTPRGECGRPAWPSRRNHRNGSRCAPWSTSPTWCHGPDPRYSCAADGGPAGGGVPAPRFPHPRACYRSAQDLSFILSFSLCAHCAAEGRTVGGSGQGGLQGFSQGLGSTAFCEQISLTFQFRVVEVSTNLFLLLYASRSPDAVDEAFTVFFLHFSSKSKKCGGRPARVVADSSSSTPAPQPRDYSRVMVITRGQLYFWNRHTGDKLEDGGWLVA